MALQFIKNSDFVVGSSETSAVQLNEGTLAGITITGSSLTATSVTFLGSTDGTNFYPLYDEESEEVTLTTGSVARGYSVDTNTFFPWNWIKAREGTSSSPVNQTVDDQDIEFNIKTL